MNRAAQKKLLAELKQAGARPDEMAGLAAVAGAIANLPLQTVQAAPKPRFGWRRLVPLAVTAVCCLFIGAGAVMYSQTALPGGALYGVQKISDDVALRVNPHYRGSLMVKRMMQLTALIDRQAGQPDIVAAAADYQSVAAGYRAGGSNYEILDFCHDSLQQAAARTTGTAHRVIEQSLKRLENV